MHAENAASGRRCVDVVASSAGDILQHVEQAIDVHGFEHVRGEAGLEALAHVVVLTVAAEGNARQFAAAPTQFAHQFDPGPVREPQVTEQQVERLASSQFQSAGHIAGPMHHVTFGRQDGFQHLDGVAVILHQEQAVTI